MRLRKLALAVGLAGSLGASVANALGLGEIKLNSTLNQPLDAEIALLQARDLTEAEILVRLASREDFQRAGVDRLFFLTDLRFRIDLDNSGGPVIRVTSRKPVREPYINFLLETQWPSGRLLREYTLLMDLPTFGDESVRPIRGAQTQRAAAQTPSTRPSQPAAPSSQAEPEPAAAPQRTSLQRQESHRSEVEVYGPVTADDTLWEIALRVRPGRSVSVHQTMLALQRLNPGAFIKGNINLLRKGQVLRVPTLAQIENVTLQQAVNEVAYQNNEWNGGVKEPAIGAQLDAAKRTVTERQTQQTIEGRVKLAAAGSAQSAEGGKGSGAESGSADALENELTAALEELDRSKRTNTELTSRISELEQQISTMERLLQVSNEELRALQLASQQKSEEAAAAEAPKKVVRSSKPAEPSLVNLLMDNILLVGAGLLAFIAGAFLFLRRRTEEPEDDSGEIAEAPEFDAELGEEPTELVQDEDVEETFDLNVEDELQLPEEEPVSAEAETGDVVSEADIYIAYGKFDQAEEMLLKALEKEPESTDIRLKLLEVYAESKDLERFDEHFLQLQSLGDDFAQQRAADLRQTIPNAGEFEPDAASLSETGGTFDAAAEIDLDLDLNALDEPVPASAEIDSTGDAADELNLDLDLEFDEKEQSSTDLNEISSGSDALTLELGDETELQASLDDIGTDLDLDFTLSEEGLGEDEALEVDLDLGDDLAEVDADDEIVLDLGIGDDEAEKAAEKTEETPPLVDDGLALDIQEMADELNVADSGNTAEDESVIDLTLGSEHSSELGDLDSDALADDALDLSADEDDFDPDLELGDIDLEALDQEVDNLAAGLDLAAEDEADLDLTLNDLEETDQALSTALDELAGDSESQTDLNGEEAPERLEDDLDIAKLEDDVFFGSSEPDTALPDFLGTDALSGEGVSEEDLEGELDFLSSTDETATKLDLARAYIDMGDTDGAKDILDEVSQEGDDQQRQEAEELLGRIG